MRPFYLTLTIILSLLLPVLAEAFEGAADRNFGVDTIPSIMSRLKSSNPERKRQAIRDLGSIRDMRAVEELIRLARGKDSRAASQAERLLLSNFSTRIISPNELELNIRALQSATSQDERTGAALALHGTIDPGAIKALITALQNDSDYWVRASSARSLCSFGNKNALPALSNAVAKDDLHVAEAAAFSMATIGPAATPSLIQSLASPDYLRKRCLAEALFKVGPGSVESILPVLKDANAELRSGAVMALACFDDKRVFPAVTVLTEDPDQGVRLEVARALNRMDDQATPALCRMARREPSHKVRSVAISSLGDRLSSEEAVDTLCGILLNDQQDQYRISAAFSMINNDTPCPRAVPSLIKALQNDPSVKVRDYSAAALGSGKDRRAVDPLVAALSDDSDDVRISAAYGLCRLSESAQDAMKDDRIVKALLNALEDRNSQVRQPAVTALSNIGDSRSVEPIIRELRRSRPTLLVMLFHDIQGERHLRLACIEALKKLRDPRAVDELIRELKGDYELKMYAIDALGKIGDQRASKPLRRLVGSRHPEIKAAAIKAINDIEDRNL